MEGHGQVSGWTVSSNKSSKHLLNCVFFFSTNIFISQFPSKPRLLGLPSVQRPKAGPRLWFLPLFIPLTSFLQWTPHTGSLSLLLSKLGSLLVKRVSAQCSLPFSKEMSLVCFPGGNSSPGQSACHSNTDIRGSGEPLASFFLMNDLRAFHTSPAVWFLASCGLPGGLAGAESR